MPINADVAWPSPQDVAALRARLGPVGVVGGAAYDALVGEAASLHGRVLLTRDRRAIPTYERLGVTFELIGP